MQGDVTMRLETKYREQFKESIFSSIVLQLILLLLSSLVLDGGILFALIEIVSVAYWVAAVIILVFRFKKLTETDFFYLKWGIFINILLGFLIILSATLIFPK